MLSAIMFSMSSCNTDDVVLIFLKILIRKFQTVMSTQIQNQIQIQTLIRTLIRTLSLGRKSIPIL